MKKSLFAILLIMLIVACNEKGKDKKFDAESYEKTKETLAEKEKNNPARFLVVNNHDRKNLIGQTVVIGTLTNKATVCWYKDVELRLTYYSKTGVKLDEGLETVYDYIAPGKSVKFKTKTFAAKGTDSVAVMVLKATGDTSLAKK